jgi:tetratricopeptide (TPR) repeat protein
MMDHPNIARVLDAGATDAGRPYFVMELVKGQPITRFCDDNRLTLGDRLALFIDACHAVQHAHQKGIIHRDLKPTNVLVSRYDDKPVVKIIDFGIAKATGAAGGRLTDKTLFTEFRQLIGTPVYMSPEQAGLSDLDIDTRSDVYSLGVLLYELLTGTTPFDAERLRSADFDEMRRIIREEEPPRPSTRLSSLASSAPASPAPGGEGGRVFEAGGGPSPAAIASARWADARSLVRLLRSEPDWIVMKCLEKDRTRRYATASDLAADVQRHLHDEPVTAGPPSRLYRLRKALRRYRGGVAASAVLLLTVTGAGIILTGYWQQARYQAEQAEAIASFMEDTLDGVDPWRSGGLDTRLLKVVMDGAAQRIRSGELRAAPEAELRLRLSIGRVYWRNAELNAAHEMLEPTEAMVRSIHPADSEQTANVLGQLALLAHHEGNMMEGLSRFQGQQAILKHIDKGDSQRVAQVQEMIIESLRDLERNEEALAAAREGLAIHRRLSPRDESGERATQMAMGFVLLSLDRQEEARSQFEDLLPRMRQFEPETPYVAWTLTGLGCCLLELGRPEEGVPLFQEAHGIMLRFYDAPH